MLALGCRGTMGLRSSFLVSLGPCLDESVTFPETHLGLRVWFLCCSSLRYDLPRSLILVLVSTWVSCVSLLAIRFWKICSCRVELPDL